MKCKRLQCKNLEAIIDIGEQGLHSGERACLPSIHVWPGSILAQYHMWVEFVVGSCLALRVFSIFSCFPSFTKTNTPNSNLARKGDRHENQLRLM